jgi:HlyD family secretion protein
MKRVLLTGTAIILWTLLVGHRLVLAEGEGDARKPRKEPRPAASRQADEQPAEKPDDQPAEKEKKKPREKKEKAEAAEGEKPPEEAKPEAEKPAEKPAEQPPARPASVKVEKGPFKIELTLDGQFEAAEMADVRLRLDEWSGLSVLRAVEHGAAVKRGELLVALETKDIDRAISDLRDDLRLSDLALRQAEKELAVAEKAAPLDLQAVERSRRFIDEDFDYFRNVAQPLAIRTAEFGLKSARQMLEYQEEELRQLEKMYNADDLTEETEAIVLQRARDAVERARFNLERTKTLTDRALETDIPREAATTEDSTRKARWSAELQAAVLPMTLEKRRLEFQKLQLQRQRSDEKLKRLLADREKMNVKAPLEGVVYYGSCDRGKWSGYDTAAESLRAGGSLTMNRVFMTVVKPRPMFVRVAVAEKQLHQVAPGMKGTVKPAGYPDITLDAIVERVAGVPAGGTYDSRITLARSRDAERIVPGMTCQVTLVVYENKEALTVPPGAVSSDEADPEKKYVFVLDADGKRQRRDVTTGKQTDKLVEILSGLEEGDEVVREK